MSITQLLAGGGTMGARIQAHDWASSPLGPPKTWPLSLQVTLSNMLRSKLPTYLVWGPELITFYNDASLPLRGVRPEALGQPLSEAWAEVWDVVSSPIKQALRGEATYLQDVPVVIIQRRGHPEMTWWTGSFSPVLSETGTVGGVLITLLETTERVLTETALRESEELFRQFAEHSTDVLWVVDAKTREMEYVSPAYERIWGQPLETMRARAQWEETVHPDDRDRTIQAFRGVQRGETVSHEYRIVRPDGSMRHIHATIFPILDEHGTVRRIGGVARDVTQHDGSMVYVVDGNVDSRRTLALRLQDAGYQVQQFTSAPALLEVAPVLLPGCVVLDTRTPEAGGLTIPKELKGRRSGLPVVVLGEAHGNTAVGVQAMKAGAVDYLDMPCQPEQLLEAVASALASIRDVAERDQTAELARARIAALPAREREVLDRLLAGGTNKTIARDLGISPRTVEAHRARVMERVGAQNLPELVRIAVAAGLQTKP